jgi:hypothetical protein
MIYFRDNIETNKTAAEHTSQVVEFTSTNETEDFIASLKWHGDQPDKHTKPVQYTEEIWQKCLDLSADTEPKWLDATGHLIHFEDSFVLKRDDVGMIIFLVRSWDDGDPRSLLIEGHASDSLELNIICCISGQRTEGLYRLAASNLSMVKHLGDIPDSFWFIK